MLFSSVYFPLSLTILLEVRRELYAQCLDELIRQTTISCVERGLLMLRLRDEARMTLHAYMVSSVQLVMSSSTTKYLTDFVRVQHCPGI